jgi:hypothetical protein
MTRSKWFLHDGRALEIRDRRFMTSFELWIYENDRPLGCHSRVALRDAAAGLAEGTDVLGRAMDDAIGDVLAGRFDPLATRASA